MDQFSIVVGLEVHKDSITVAILPPQSMSPSEVKKLENHPTALKRLARDLRARRPVFVYEAGPCGYEVQRQLKALGQ